MLLTRDTFRNDCLKRDGEKCVICKESQNLAVHHIVERRLFENGGYYIDNGATLCEKCHILAEKTDLSCEEIRKAAGIKNVIIPDLFYPDEKIDKWGNCILSNGQRTIGPLFFDESVQRIIKHIIPSFTDRIKYPRTPHLPFSEGVGEDDIIKEFDPKDKCVVTIKYDGECTTMGNDRFTNEVYCHARSVSSKTDATRHYVQGLSRKIGIDIPPGWRICGENLYAKHTIYYTDLKDYFYLFSIWNDKNVCLSWDQTKEWASLLGLQTVEVLYEGEYDAGTIKKLHKSDREGFVVRSASEFPYSQFYKNVGKFVSSSFKSQMSNVHWKKSVLEKNLRGEITDTI